MSRLSFKINQMGLLVLSSRVNITLRVGLFLHSAITFCLDMVSRILRTALMSSINDRNAVLFTTTVSDPNHYCVVGFNEKKEIVKLVEKPEKQFSDTVGIGFYSFPDDTCDLLENVELSIRGSTKSPR